MEKRGHNSNAEARAMKKFNNYSYYTAAATTASASIFTATDNHRDECYTSGQLLWPPRSYTCCFCRREFRSAQALGGHMNVHRRDRARLRRSSPPFNITPPLNLNLSPNHYTNNIVISTSLPCSSSPKKIQSLFDCSTSSSAPPAAPSSSSSPASSPVAVLSEPPKKPAVACESIHGWSLKEGDGFDGSCGYLEKKADQKVAKLDLEFGVFKEDLDLELRLGYN